VMTLLRNRRYLHINVAVTDAFYFLIAVMHPNCVSNVNKMTTFYFIWNSLFWNKVMS